MVQKDDLSKVFSYLKHPIRFKIVELLYQNNELSFTQLMREIKINDKGKLSFHLRKMKELIEHDNKTKKCRPSNLGRSSYNIISGIKEKSSEIHKLFYEMAKRNALRLSNYTMTCLLMGAIFNPLHMLVFSVSTLFTVQSLLNPRAVPAYFQLLLILFYLGISLVSIFFSFITKRLVIKPIMADAFENKDRRWVWLLFYRYLLIQPFESNRLSHSSLYRREDKRPLGIFYEI
jgi:hypothetical protein